MSQKLFFDANICLDLLDTTRPTAASTVAWYMRHKDDYTLTFYFSGDFITSFYYILTERKKLDKHKVVRAIDALCQEVTPVYLDHTDYLYAKEAFWAQRCDDFEDLIVLSSALRYKCQRFLTNDKRLLRLGTFDALHIEGLA